MLFCLSISNFTSDRFRGEDQRTKALFVTRNQEEEQSSYKSLVTKLRSVNTGNSAFYPSSQRPRPEVN